LILLVVGITVVATGRSTAGSGLRALARADLEVRNHDGGALRAHAQHLGVSLNLDGRAGLELTRVNTSLRQHLRGKRELHAATTGRATTSGSTGRLGCGCGSGRTARGATGSSRSTASGGNE
jgi:hypothetical protein